MLIYIVNKIVYVQATLAPSVMSPEETKVSPFLQESIQFFLTEVLWVLEKLWETVYDVLDLGPSWQKLHRGPCSIISGDYQSLSSGEQAAKRGFVLYSDFTCGNLEFHDYWVTVFPVPQHSPSDTWKRSQTALRSTTDGGSFSRACVSLEDCCGPAQIHLVPSHPWHALTSGEASRWEEALGLALVQIMCQ